MTTRETNIDDRLVAGLRCMEVLARLSAYLDGELGEGEVAELRAHVEGCTTCERFGGRFATAVGALRRVPEPPLDAEVSRRLADELGLEPMPVS